MTTTKFCTRCGKNKPIAEFRHKCEYCQDCWLTPAPQKGTHFRRYNTKAEFISDGALRILWRTPNSFLPVAAKCVFQALVMNFKWDQYGHVAAKARELAAEVGFAIPTIFRNINELARVPLIIRFPPAILGKGLSNMYEILRIPDVLWRFNHEKTMH